VLFITVLAVTVHN